MGFWAVAGPIIASAVGAYISSKGSGGGSSGGYQGSQSTLTHEQGSLLARLAPFLEGQIGQGISMKDAPYKSPSQQQIYDLLPGMIRDQKDELYFKSQDALGNMLGEYDPTDARNFWESSVVNPAMEKWRTDIVPAMDEMFVSRNALSSGARNRSLAESGRRLTTDLSSQLGSLLYKDKADWRSGQLKAIPQASALGTAQLGDLTQLLGLSTVEAAGEMEKWKAEQAYNNPWLQYLSTALGGGRTENVYQQPGDAPPNFLSSFFGSKDVQKGMGDAFSDWGEAIGDWGGWGKTGYSKTDAGGAFSEDSDTFA